jgi:hypothetical protein
MTDDAPARLAVLGEQEPACCKPAGATPCRLHGGCSGLSSSPATASPPRTPCRKACATVVQAGGRLTPHGEKIAVEAPAPLPQDVLALVREHKAALPTVLAQGAPTNDATATAPSTEAVSTYPGHLSFHPPCTPASQWARHFAQATRSGSTGGIPMPHGLLPP